VYVDRPSNTAAYVAMGRALAHARGRVGLDDPCALALLPDDARAAVERILARRLPRSRREGLLMLIALSTERLMGPRTREIDAALEELPPGHQVVILGAGLDARAYRMRSLATSVVFEVDHPASQAEKRRVTAGLRPLAAELRHLAVDFERERFGDALARGGHDSGAPTAWIFEGVITYLLPADVAASIDAIAARSAPGSRLFATYNEPGFLRPRLARVVMPAGEPSKAAYRPGEMRALLAARGFRVVSDRDGLARARRWTGGVSALELAWIRHHHVVIADR
jgi:methyltransferase (TIGR00027 family)